MNRGIGTLLRSICFDPRHSMRRVGAGVVYLSFIAYHLNLTRADGGSLSFQYYEAHQAERRRLGLSVSVSGSLSYGRSGHIRTKIDRWPLEKNEILTPISFKPLSITVLLARRVQQLHCRSWSHSLPTASSEYCTVKRSTTVSQSS
jgi:hypothetical protein